MPSPDTSFLFHHLPAQRVTPRESALQWYLYTDYLLVWVSMLRLVATLLSVLWGLVSGTVACLFTLLPLTVTATYWEEFPYYLSLGQCIYSDGCRVYRCICSHSAVFTLHVVITGPSCCKNICMWILMHYEQFTLTVIIGSYTAVDLSIDGPTQLHLNSCKMFSDRLLLE